MPRSPATTVSAVKRQEPAERRPKVLDERIGDDVPIAAHAGPLERSPFADTNYALLRKLSISG